MKNKEGCYYETQRGFDVERDGLLSRNVRVLYQNNGKDGVSFDDETERGLLLNKKHNDKRNLHSNNATPSYQYSPISSTSSYPTSPHHPIPHRTPQQHQNHQATKSDQNSALENVSNGKYTAEIEHISAPIKVHIEVPCGSAAWKSYYCFLLLEKTKNYVEMLIFH